MGQSTHCRAKHCGSSLDRRRNAIQSVVRGVVAAKRGATRLGRAPPSSDKPHKERSAMSKTLIALSVLLASQSIRVGNSYAATDDDGQQIPQSSSVNPVVEWNRTLLAIVRTPGAQPATVHPTHSFALMHAAIYDSVNSIDRTHRPYLVQLFDVSRHASQDAAADAAAHEVLTQL